MGAVDAGQLRPARRGVGLEVAADVAGGQPDRAQARDTEVGEVLADALALPKTSASGVVTEVEPGAYAKSAWIRGHSEATASSR